MRNKYQVGWAVGFVGLFCLAGACGDDSGGTPSGNAAGESGAGADTAGSSGKSNQSAGNGNATSGSGGKSSAGDAGMTSSNGGEPMGDAGKPSGDGGQPSGDGGKPSSNGGEPAGGNSSGNGGEPSGEGGAAAGAAGAGGASESQPVACTPITVGAFGEPQVDFSFAVYVTSFTPNIGTVASDNFRLAFAGPPADGHRTGTFDLTQNGDDNYLTCARCVLVYADGGQKIFYQSEGALQIAAGSKQLGGTIDATITNLKLIEVTIDGDSVSTPVPNGACLTVASATIKVQAPTCTGFECSNGYCITDADWECDESPDCPDDSDEFPINTSCAPYWQCPDSWYGDGDCDCGCGIQDDDCTGTTDQNECKYCVTCQDNSMACEDGQVKPADTTQCL